MKAQSDSATYAADTAECRAAISYLDQFIDANQYQGAKTWDFLSAGFNFLKTFAIFFFSEDRETLSATTYGQMFGRSSMVWSAFTMEKMMKTKLILAISAALVLSTAASAVQTDDQSRGDTVQTVKTVTTVQHINGSDATWYRQGGVVPDAYRGDNYAVQHWQDEHLNEPSEGSHWVRGNNGDFLLVDNGTGTITNIVQNTQH